MPNPDNSTSDSKDKTQKIQALTRVGENLISLIDPKPKREGLEKTPERFAKSMEFLTSGYQPNYDEIKQAIFEDERGQIVLIRDIEFYSLCEHHMLPFFGVAHVAYIPSGKIIGLSKLARLVNIFSRRLQVQERITRELAEKIQELLNPLGVFVLVEAHHLCMMMRGVEKQGSKTLTRTSLGAFETDESLKNEVYAMVNKQGK